MYTLLLNICWTYELYISVKNPMVFSEMNINVYSKLLHFLAFGGTALIHLKYTQSEESYTILCQNQPEGDLYMNYIFYPTVVSILVCLGVNLRYGKDKYLRTFRKNSHKFRLLFRLHFYYMLFWGICSSLSFAPILAPYISGEQLRKDEWVGI